MTLLQLLQDIDPDMPLKLGTENGTAYFYCGTVGEFRKKLDSYSEKGRKFYEDGYLESKRELDSLVNHKPTLPNTLIGLEDAPFREVLAMIVEYTTEEKPSPVKLQLLRYIAELGKWSRKTAAVSRREKEVKSLFDVWIPYGERTVVDVFRADNAVEPEETSVIRISGYECGKYWVISDANGKRHFDPVMLSRGARELISDGGDDDAEE